MLSQTFKGKTIAILGVKSLLGKLLLKKILAELSSVERIVILYTRPIKKQFETIFDEIMCQDQYFEGMDIEKAKNIVEFVGYDEDSVSTTSIDILYNCLLPADYTKTSMERYLDLHIWKSLQICDFLRKFKSVKKIVMGSSIYCQTPGYISENVKEELSSKLLKLSINVTTKGKLLDDVKDIFQNQREIWQWSIMYMQMIFGKHSGASKVEIVRFPSLGPTLTDYEGYSISFNSFLTLIYEIGNGFLDSLEGIETNIIDIIPADFAINYMITISAIAPSPLVFNAEQQSQLRNRYEEREEDNLVVGNISIHNLSSSSRNPINFGVFCQYIVEGWSQFSEKKLKFKIRQKKWQKQLYNFKNNIPRQTRNRIAIFLDIKPWKIQTQQEYVSLAKKKETIKKYKYYFEKEWICESNKSIDYYFSMTQQDQKTFNFNINAINWKTYAKLCCYSIQKFLLGLQIEKFTPSNLDLLSLQRSTYFSDIFWALSEGKSISIQNSHQVKNYILSTKSVKEAIKQLVQQQIGKLQQTPMAYEKVEQQYYKFADEMCEQMFSQYSMASIRGFAWFLHKVFRTIYEKVVIDKDSIAKLRSYDEATNGPIIIIPTHRSYIDFLIMSYVFFSYGIKCPHIAAAEDFLNMAVVHVLLRKSGAFFIKRNMKKNRILYKAIMNEYISKLLGQNHYLQFFVQGTRSRSGKMLSPKYGILSIVAKNVLDSKIPDAQILPITLNYEKVLQGVSFTYEMMGQSKVKESLSRLIKAADVLKQNFGRIYVEFCEPISIKKYFKKSFTKYAERKQMFELTLNDLGYDIVYAMTKKLVITPPAILSSIILMHRIGISDERLSQKVNWLCKQLSIRGVKVARTQADSSVSVSNTLSLMSQAVNKSKKDMFEVQVTFDQFSFAQLFTLTYYRNTLTHIFFEEAILAVCLTSFGHQNMITGNIALSQFFKKIEFLKNLLSKEYVLQHYLDNQNRVKEVLNYMEKRQVLKIVNAERILIENPQADLFSLYCSLVWPVIQSYWITCLYLFKLKKDNIVLDLAKLQSEIQWFGQSLFTERVILHLQAISMDTLKNSTATLIDMKIMGQNKQGGKKGMKVIVDEQILKQLENKISLFLKSKYAASVKGILNTGRSSVTLDFPFLSRL